MLVARSPSEHSVSFRVQEIQLDDQSAEITAHPVVFSPSTHIKRGEPFLDFSFVRALDVVDAYHVRFLALQMLSADLKLADQFLWHLWQYADFVSAATSHTEPQKVCS